MNDLSSGVVTHRFLYGNGLAPLAEVDAAGTVTTRYVYTSPTPWGAPDSFTRGGVTYAVVKDVRGSVRRVVRATDGVVVQAMDYDATGQITRDTAPEFQPFGFAGGLWDGATGLVHFGAREYDPRLARWTTKDPIGFQGGLNWYGYANGDPVNFVDLSGNGPRGAAVGGAVGTVFGGAIGLQAGAATGFIVGLPTGPGELVAIPVGAIGGFGLGAAAGGLAGALIGSAIEDLVGIGCESRGDRPEGLPTGTRPIDQAGLGRGKIHTIKAGANLRPDTWTGVSPDGTIWANDGEGTAIPVGHVDDEDDGD